MDYLPITLRINDARILIVGGGRVATHKATILHRFTDRARVVAPVISDELKALPFTCEERPFAASDLDDTDVLFVCTGDHDLNAAIREEARSRHILTSVCDDPPLCDFISPAIAEYGNLTIAVGSDSRDVKRSIRVRDRIRQLVETGLLDIE
jgi:siroheme synthase-like protein